MTTAPTTPLRFPESIELNTVDLLLVQSGYHEKAHRATAIRRISHRAILPTYGKKKHGEVLSSPYYVLFENHSGSVNQNVVPPCRVGAFPSRNACAAATPT